MNATIATVQVGHQYPDHWVGKLARGVSKNIIDPHTFIIYTDRPSASTFQFSACSHQLIKLVDIKATGLDGYFSKLKLFDQTLTGQDPFLFLDLTLIVRSNLEPLIEMGRTAPASLIGVKDWNYPILNSSVLWINPDTATQSVWDAWQDKRYLGLNFPGDQNFIFKVFQAENKEKMAYWPDKWIASYKSLLKIASRNSRLAAEILSHSKILKFHGKPKMDSVLKILPPASLFFRYPFKPKLWRYLQKDIKSHWI